MQDSAPTPDTPTQAEPSDLVRFDSITNAAFKQWKKLSRKIQRMVAVCLKEGKHSYLCTVVMGQAHLDVKHFRVSQSVRVSYMPHNGENCVVHIGVHSEFDKFSCNFTGISPNQKIYTLQETIFMPNGKQNTSSSKPKQNKSAGVGNQNDQSPKQPAGWGMFKQAVTSVLDDQVNQTLITYESNFERVGSRVDRLTSDVKANIGKLDSVESTQISLEKRFKKCETGLNELKAEQETTSSAINRLDTCDKQRNDSIHKLQNEASRLDGLLTTTKESVLTTGVKLNGLRNELNQATSRHTSAQEKLASDHKTLVGNHESLANEKTELVKQVDILKVSNQALQTEANDLGSALSTATNRIAELESQTKEQREQLAAQAAEFRNALESESKRVNELEAQASSMQSQHETETNRLQQSLANAAQRIETLEAQFAEFQNQQRMEKAARDATFLQRIRRFFRGGDTQPNAG